MLFNSLTFVLFLLVVLGLYYSLRNWRQQKWLLLISSYFFYAAWNPPFVLLLMFSTAVDWFIAKAIAGTQEQRRKRLLLIISLISNLGLLAYFKYGNFMLENFITLSEQFGIAFTPAKLDIVLPIGISFYTFQTLSYTLDVYRGKLQPARSWLDFAFFVTFFPQLVAGPIVRASDFLPQCVTPRKASMDQLGWGLALISFGVFSKVVLSDKILAPLADAGYAHIHLLTSLDAWVTVLAFSGQIFFDFSGYSTAAIGAALCFGFVLPDNFKAPYMAIGFSDFWRRWHISLSTWLKDYLYIPLGGNRIAATRTYFNLLFTMLVGGLWHGASWLFVVWGGLHGLYLALEHLLRARFSQYIHLPRSDLLKLSLGVMTFLVVSITWIFFRADSLDNAMALLGKLLFLIPSPDNPMLQDYPADNVPTAFLLLIALLSWHWLTRESSLEAIFQRLPLAVRCAALSYALLALIFTTGGDSRAFIYFQF